jgi:hypothetical protein
MKTGPASELCVSRSWASVSQSVSQWCPTLNPFFSKGVPVSQYVCAGTYRRELSISRWRSRAERETQMFFYEVWKRLGQPGHWDTGE